MSDTKEVLTKARKLLEDPDRWTQGYFAKNAAGEIVEAISPKAICFCSIGALQKVTGRETVVDVSRASFILFKAGQELYGTLFSVVTFNDAKKTTHEQILALFDKAISLANERETS